MRSLKEAQKEERTVHFGTLMDICHLKNSELEPEFQKYKGRVVLRGDSVKDDSGGSYAVFTEQGSTASQMMAAEVMDVTFKTIKMCTTSSRRNISLHPSQNGGPSKIIGMTKVRVPRSLDSQGDGVLRACPKKGGGGRARVPNLRVCEHPVWEVAHAGEQGELTSCRGTVQSAWQSPSS